jgi:flagellar assembly protein FliH
MDQEPLQDRPSPAGPGRLVARSAGRCRILDPGAARVPFAPPSMEELDPPAAPPVAEPEPVPPPPPRFELDDLARVAAFAWHEGRTQARAEAVASLEARLLEAQDAIAAGLAGLAETGWCERDAATLLATELALALARAIVPAALARAPLDDIAGMVADCLARLHDAPPLEILVAADLVEPCRLQVERLAGEAGYGGEIRVTVDPRLAPGDARVAWPEGGAKRDLRAIAAEAEGLVQRLLPQTNDDN